MLWPPFVTDPSCHNNSFQPVHLSGSESRKRWVRENYRSPQSGFPGQPGASSRPCEPRSWRVIQGRRVLDQGGAGIFFAVCFARCES